MVHFLTLGKAITHNDQTKEVRESVCDKISELLADGFEIISVSESFAPGKWDDGAAMMMSVSIYYKTKE